MKSIFLAALIVLAPTAFAGLFDGGFDECPAPAGTKYQCNLLKGPIYLQPNYAVTFPFIHCNDADTGDVTGGFLNAELRGSLKDTWVKIPLSAFSGVDSFQMPLEVSGIHGHRASVCRRVP